MLIADQVLNWRKYEINGKKHFEAKILGKGTIKISQAYENDGLKARDTADNMLDKLYGFHLGPVLFKPTLSGGHQTFRQTKEGALSYFGA